MTLDYWQNFISAQYLENKLMELDQIGIDVDQLYIRIFRLQLSQIYNMVMALGCCQNFFSAQYLVNKLMEFDQILHMH